MINQSNHQRMSLSTDRLYSLTSAGRFTEAAFEIFRRQSKENPVYREYLGALGKDPRKVTTLEEIPCLPVSFFRTRTLITGHHTARLVFASSGTTGQPSSQHFITHPELYDRVLTATFTHFYGPPADYCILALLPSYLERKNSSLVYMMEKLIMLGGHPHSGFFLNNTDDLVSRLEQLERQGLKTLLFGVSFALYDLAVQYPMKLKNTIIMETGGMKGRRKEITRNELHAMLKKAFSVKTIHSEYGMTELLSQAYSKGEGIYFTPPTMRVLIRDSYDPFSYLPAGQTGGINIIDLANMHSCSFVETEDLGKMHPDGGFEVLGRFDQSEVRGCNLMIE